MKLFWSKVWVILKSYGIVLAAITLISTAAIKVDRKRQHDNEVDNSLQELVETTHNIDKRLKIIESSINKLNNKVDNLHTKVQTQGEAIEQTQTSFKQFALRDKTLTTDEFYQYMQNLRYENDKRLPDSLYNSYTPVIRVSKINGKN